MVQKVLKMKIQVLAVFAGLAVGLPASMAETRFIGPDSAVTQNMVGQVKARRLNLRGKPEYSSTILAKIPGGTLVVVYPDHSDSWYRTGVLIDGTFLHGWTHKRFVRLIGPAKVSPTRQLSSD